MTLTLVLGLELHKLVSQSLCSAAHLCDNGQITCILKPAFPQLQTGIMVPFFQDLVLP